jgi:hypothetical protein
MRKSVILGVMILAALVCVYSAETSIAGKWTGKFDSQVGVQKYTFEFKVEGKVLKGTAISEIGDAGSATKETTPITEGKIDGNKITFTENLNYQGQALKMVYEGTVSGDEIKLKRTEGGGNEEFTVKRVK